jgi:very-short-patch-repair endonuclease
MYKKGMSSYQIAEKLGTYSRKVLRAMDYLNIPRRNYSDAQSVALKSGRSEHPTKGKEVSDEMKLRLSASLVKSYENLPEEEKVRRAQVSKDRWNAMSESEQEELRALAIAGCREAAEYGSKTEQYIRDGLRKQGHTVKTQVQDLVRHKQLRVDLFVPGLKTAIEIDGPSHFLPIWGEERLAKQQASDQRKLGDILDAGYCIIRLKQKTKTLSLAKQDEALDLIAKQLAKIEKKFPAEGKRLIELEF